MKCKRRVRTTCSLRWQVEVASEEGWLAPAQALVVAPSAAAARGLQLLAASLDGVPLCLSAAVPHNALCNKDPVATQILRTKLMFSLLGAYGLPALAA